MDVSPESTARLVLECATAAFTAVAAFFGWMNHKTGTESKSILTTNTAKIDATQAAVAPQTVKE